MLLMAGTRLFNCSYSEVSR